MTYALQCFPDALLLDLRSGPIARMLAAEPERLHETLDAAAVDRWVVIDEVQRVPAILDAVHQRVDQADGRWSNHDGVVLFMLQRTTADSAFSQYGYGTYQLDARTWSYDYSRIESLSGAIGGPTQVTTDRRDSRSFSVSRKGSKIILTFAGRDDDRREYDGPFFTLIQDGQVVRK